MSFKDKMKEMSEKVSTLNQEKENDETEENNSLSNENILYVKVADEYVPVGMDQIKKKYEDDVGARLVIIVDEVAELVQQSGLKSEAGKAEDAIKQEISMILQSLTQLGRSAGIHCILATQRNDTSVISGIIQNNSIAIDTKLLVKRDM